MQTSASFYCQSSHFLKQENNELQCVFKYPFDLCDKTRLEFEPVNSKDKTLKYRA